MKLGVPCGRFFLKSRAKKPDCILMLIAKSMIFVSPRELTRILSGFTSQVFEVIEPHSNRHFAMKLLLPEAAHVGDQRAALFNEAEIGIKLAHQNVIRIHKVNRSQETP